MHYKILYDYCVKSSRNNKFSNGPGALYYQTTTLSLHHSKWLYTPNDSRLNFAHPLNAEITADIECSFYCQ